MSWQSEDGAGEIKQLTVITGRGAHSAGGRSVLKPAVERLCQQKKLRWTAPADNPGVLILHLPENERRPIMIEARNPGFTAFEKRLIIDICILLLLAYLVGEFLRSCGIKF